MINFILYSTILACSFWGSVPIGIPQASQYAFRINRQLQYQATTGGITGRITFSLGETSSTMTDYPLSVALSRNQSLYLFWKAGDNGTELLTYRQFPIEPATLATLSPREDLGELLKPLVAMGKISFIPQEDGQMLQFQVEFCHFRPWEWKRAGLYFDTRKDWDDKIEVNWYQNFMPPNLTKPIEFESGPGWNRGKYFFKGDEKAPNER